MTFDCNFYPENILLGIPEGTLSPVNSLLIPFSENPRCIKCNRPECKVAYCKKSKSKESCDIIKNLYDEKEFQHIEHLTVICKRCGYIFPMECFGGDLDPLAEHIEPPQFEPIQKEKFYVDMDYAQNEIQRATLEMDKRRFEDMAREKKYGPCSKLILQNYIPQGKFDAREHDYYFIGESSNSTVYPITSYIIGDSESEERQ